MPLIWSWIPPNCCRLDNRDSRTSTEAKETAPLKRLITAWTSGCLLCVGVARAEIQTQHAFDTSVTLPKVEMLWHLRVRTKPEGGGLFQIRTGPIFEIDLSDRVTLMAGSYFTREQDDDRWATTHRPFAGGEVMLWDRGFEVDWRSLLERFVVTQEPDYFRFRNRFRVSPPGRTAPYAGVEIFVDGEGLRTVRYSAGVRRNFTDTFIVDFGYFFEDRRPMPSGERHMFSTSFHWRNKIRRIDPDF
jgi:hypothetical protein